MATARFTGIHHLKVPVSDLNHSLDWYERVLGARRNPEHDHRTPLGVPYAYILAIPDIEITLELRLAPRAAKAMSGFDPVTYSVRDRSHLHSWTNHLDQLGVEHSGVLRGIIGWVLVFQDPDGTAIRLYTDELHPFDEVNADLDSPWLRLALDDQVVDTP